MPKKHKEMLHWFETNRKCSLRSESKMNIWKWAKKGIRNNGDNGSHDIWV